MRIKILTLFPEMFSPLSGSILGRARDNGILDLEILNIRDYSRDKHGKCDDTPFGGGAGMVMTPQPIYDAIRAADPEHRFLRVYVSPKGERFDHALARTLGSGCGRDGLLLLCGHYEGIDQRALDLTIDREISIGDYVLTGGELAAMVIVDALSRFVPGVLGSAESALDESFSDGLLEYPQYTRPQEFMGLSVPPVLLSGHHANIEAWRREQARVVTEKNRPDLLSQKRDA